MTTLKILFQQYNQRVSDMILEYTPRITSAAIVMLAAVIASLVVRKIILSVAARKHLSGQKLEVTKLIVSIVSSVILVTGLVSALGTLGVNVSAIVAGLGLSGFAFGFALRDALSNLLSGILIILYQPFKVGDVIVVSGFEGEVSEINLRYTVLHSGESKFMIPNSNIFNTTVTLKKRRKNL